MKKIVLLLLALVAWSNSFAQVERGLWDYGPVISTTNNAYGFFAENIKMYAFGSAGESGVNFLNNNRWWIPTFRSRIDVLKSISSPNDDYKIKRTDWGIRSISVGYHVGYMSYVFPLGFDLQLDYEKQNWKLKNLGNDTYKNCAKNMVVPTALLKARIGDFTRDQFNFFLEGGAKYNYAFKTRGYYNDVKSTNNGFTGVLGMGVINPRTHTSIALRYEHDFYNYFNTDYSPDGIIKPYEGFKTKHSSLDLFVTIAF